MPYAAAAGRSLHYQWVGEETGGKPALVFLHEGLGSIGQWRDFPANVAAATGCRALVYDRYGHGHSDVLAERKRPVRFMHDEALLALPDLLRTLGVANPVLVGHSDGASISLIHAGGGNAVRGIVAMAPHVFVEPVCLKEIDKAAQAFETTDFQERLGKYHRDARATFYGWAGVWRDEEFRSWDIRYDYLPAVTCPVLGMQGHDDAYGTPAQLAELRRRVGGPCQLLELDECGHAPFRDQPERTLEAVTRFIRGLA
jgi:pimeloyl-ACP methyl ester carboxylesterase